ncbi:hypothetical protein N7461_008584 [Penicillium sp. DV-2018c]|nr:hypothetical protein N7461_008584 [Penicillium sp. DV-2018c]
MWAPWKFATALQLLLLLSHTQAADIPCSVENPCTEGCCSSVSQVCGYGPSYCGSPCIAGASLNGTCKHLAECNPGVYPGWGDVWGIYHLPRVYDSTVHSPLSLADYYLTTASNYSTAQTCPLDVCCSEYGFCGTTSLFCGDTEWPSPSCSGTSSVKRRIGYFEADDSGRSTVPLYFTGKVVANHSSRFPLERTPTCFSPFYTLTQTPMN